jgi:hypothetical protein
MQSTCQCGWHGLAWGGTSRRRATLTCLAKCECLVMMQLFFCPPQACITMILGVENKNSDRNKKKKHRWGGRITSRGGPQTNQCQKWLCHLTCQLAEALSGPKGRSPAAALQAVKEVQSFCSSSWHCLIVVESMSDSGSTWGCPPLSSSYHAIHGLASYLGQRAQQLPQHKCVMLIYVLCM